VVRRSALVAGATAGAAAWCWPAASPVAPWLARAGGIPLRLPEPRGVALTFDDGPHPQGTPAVLELLARANAVATFFLVGEQVQRWPRVAAEIAAAGHEIALHGYRHRLLLRRPTPLLADDLDRATDVIASVTGRVPVVYRPPYGILSAGALELVRRRGLSLLLWSRWGRDWGAHEDPARIAQRASGGLVPGDVVLLHDADHYSSPASWERTVAALPSILERTARLGEPLVSASQST
jgi:peptidoglycan/xylan/chitin deacetylase (PgdA/CDA1 family)